MKTELISFHRKLVEHAKQHGPNYAVMLEFRSEVLAFHEQAVAWLESLDEGLSISAAAETRIQRENLEKP